jgi:hypothetical protein
MGFPTRRVDTPSNDGADVEREHGHPSETRIATTTLDLMWFESSLGHAEACVARMQSTPTTRRLKVTLEILRLAIASWSTTPPTEEERWLFREHLAEVLDLAPSNGPTLRPKRPACTTSSDAGASPTPTAAKRARRSSRTSRSS